MYKEDWGSRGLAVVLTKNIINAALLIYQTIVDIYIFALGGSKFRHFWPFSSQGNWLKSQFDHLVIFSLTFFCNDLVYVFLLQSTF